MKVELHPEAETELYEAAAWYDDQRSGLGDDLPGHAPDELWILESKSRGIRRLGLP